MSKDWSQHEGVNEGSVWRKWDLHVHTPETKLSDGYGSDENAWSEYCRVLHESDIDAFGITDYFSVDTFYDFEEHYRRRYGNDGKVFFPNIELRLDVSVNKAAEEVNLHVIFDNLTGRTSIERFLQRLNTTKTESGASVTCFDLSGADYERASVSMGGIVAGLRETFGDVRPYVIVAAANNAGIRADNRSPRKLVISDEIDRKSQAFFAGHQSVDYFLRTDRYADGSPSLPKPVFACSDSHSFGELELYLGQQSQENGRTHKDVTWVKADLSFEGLRQALFEPSHRVKIRKTRPPHPPKRISTMTVEYPATATIQRRQMEPTPFCLAGVRVSLAFSPYLTCLIGGRGSGKSTLLNVLEDAITQEARTEFLKQNTLAVDGSPAAHSSFVHVDHSVDDLEFLQQDEIEEYATHPRKFTDAIYSRIRLRNSAIAEHERTVSDELESAEHVIELLSKKQAALERQRDTADSLRSNEKISETIEGDEYQALTGTVAGYNKDIVRIRSERSRLQRLREDTDSLMKNHPPVTPSGKVSRYTTNYNAFIEKLSALRSELLSDDAFRDLISEEDDLAKKHSDSQERLGEYLEGLGITPENLEDIKNSSSRIDSLRADLDAIEEEIRKLDDEIESHDESRLTNSFDALIAAVSCEIANLRGVLAQVNEANPSDVERIEFDLAQVRHSALRSSEKRPKWSV